VKLHLVLDHDGYLPSVAVITEGKHADVRVARRLRFLPGTIVVMDRGYLDFTWFGQLTAQGVFFVTRPKHNTAYRSSRRAPFPSAAWWWPTRSSSSPGRGPSAPARIGCAASRWWCPRPGR